jgi:hypothetical protein
MIVITTVATITGLVMLLIAGVAMTVLVGRLLQAVRIRIAAPLVAEAKRGSAEREQLIRECGESAVQAVVAAQRETIAGVAHEGFSAMVQINRDLLSEVHAMRIALLQSRNMVVVESVVPETAHRLESVESFRRTLPSRIPLYERIRFWKR